MPGPPHIEKVSKYTKKRKRKLKKFKSNIYWKIALEHKILFFFLVIKAYTKTVEWKTTK